MAAVMLLIMFGMFPYWLLACAWLCHAPCGCAGWHLIGHVWARLRNHSELTNSQKYLLDSCWRGRAYARGNRRASGMCFYRRAGHATKIHLNHASYVYYVAKSLPLFVFMAFFGLLS